MSTLRKILNSSVMPRNGADMKRIREKAGLTQGELSKLLDIDRTSIIRKEKDERGLTASEALDLELLELASEADQLNIRAFLSGDKIQHQKKSSDVTESNSDKFDKYYPYHPHKTTVTIQRVKEYAESKKISVARIKIESFIRHHEKDNWMDHGHKVSDWRILFRRWMR